MILFIDDEPARIEPYINSVSALGLQTTTLASIEAVEAFLGQRTQPPTCIVLDVMFPGDPGLPSALTAKGLNAGMALFGPLRAHFPDVPILVLTNTPSLEVKRFFEDQDRCVFYYKTDLLSDQFAKVVADLARDRGREILARLTSCPAGRAHARQFEAICVVILDYLFVPPLGQIISQPPRAGGHDIRDAVLANNASDYFWSRLRQELDARFVVAEFKNYTTPVRKNEVIQLRIYLKRRTLGRFGLLLSRLPPSQSALQARADAYADQECLILFLEDTILQEMIELRRKGRDPARVLQLIKEQFELDY
jgi:CheY-like chemotaxis protein